MTTPPGLAYAGNSDRVTADRGYLNALVRRANPHDATPVDPASITISRIEYDNLLRLAGDYQSLRNALIKGGADIDTLDILVNAPNPDVRKDSVLADEKGRPERPKSQTKQYVKPAAVAPLRHTQNLSRVTSTPTSSNDRTTFDGHGPPCQETAWRPITYDTSISHGAMGHDDEDDIFDEIMPATSNFEHPPSVQSQGTLFFSGLSVRTTYKDLMSIIKGGKIISSVLHNNSALVTLASGAAEFLAWSKRNDIYLQGKRIEVSWAEHQFRIQNHINDKISRGVTRNILIHNAASKGLTEKRIREDMEHISNLVIIDVRFHGANAFIYTNSIGYATFARTCMMSRKEYKGCRVWYFDDECDVALPQRKAKSFVPPSMAAKQKAQNTVVPNRFGLLNTEGTEAGSDEENQDPDNVASEYEDTSYANSEFGVRLDFLDSEV